MQESSFARTAQWYPVLLNSFEKEMHCLGQAFMHKPQPLHFSGLILIVGIILDFMIFYL